MRAFSLILFALLLFAPQTGKGQGTQIEFGKNVVQHKDFDWMYYQTEFFDVYFYNEGRELARYVVANGEKYLREVERKLDYPAGEKIVFMVYNSYSDFRQSNYRVNEDAYNIGGRTPIVSNRAFIYFNGNHFDFNSQISQGISRIILNEMVLGGSLQERVQNNVLMSLPEWYVEGLVDFLGNNWTYKEETKLKNGITTGRFKKFKKLKDWETTLVGHSIWKYVYEQYGEAALANIVYITRSTKNLENGFAFVLGKPFSDVFAEWYNYHYHRYNAKKGNMPSAEVELKLKKVFKKGEVTRWAINATGTYASVVTNDRGKVKIWVVDLEKNKKRRIFSMGYRRQGPVYDFNYPVIVWSPIENTLTAFLEDKSELFYFQYKVAEKKRTEKQIIPSLSRVLSADFHANGRQMALSAIRGGQTDIFTFDIRSQMVRPLTDDIYNDLDPRFVNNSKGIAFSTNRPDNTLRKINSTHEYTFNNNFDIYFFPDFMKQPRVLKQLTYSPSNDLMPDAFDTTYMSYLTDENGILNRNAVRYDSIFQHIRVVLQSADTSLKKNDTLRFFRNNPSAIVLSESMLNDTLLSRVDTAFIYKDTSYIYPLTNFNESILSYQVRTRVRAVYDLFNFDGKYHLYRNGTPNQIGKNTTQRLNGQEQKKPGAGEQKKTQKVLKFDINNIGEPVTDAPVKDTISRTQGAAKENYFQTGFPPRKEKPQDTESAQRQDGQPAQTGRDAAQSARNEPRRIRYASESPYFPSFAPDFLVTQIDNSIINSPYLPYVPGDHQLNNPVINGMFKIGTSDLFKDHRVIGGFRVLANIRGAEYFLTYENLKKRLDKRYTFFRRAEVKDINGYSFYRVASHEGRAEFRWPFSETSSVRMSGFGRLDNTIYLASERPSLERQNDPVFWAGTRGEYVFDNTINTGLNLYNGTRLKVYTEFFNAMNRENTFFTVLGGDFRTYTKLSRQIIWANRLAMATSIGQAKVAYFMGGVDSWLFPAYNQENLVDPEQNFVYKTMATNMRGFMQNIRNGNSYAVVNSEVRVPVFKYLINRPIRNQFIENFQVIGFLDAGSAWNGFSPLEERNAYSRRVIENGPLSITVITLRDPWVYGYGFGFRSTLLGYFLRLDYAWGVEDRERKPRIVYFSLGLDF